MTQDEFIFKLNELRRKARPVEYVGGAITFLINLAIILYTFHLYPPGSRSNDAVIAYVVSCIAMLPFVLAYGFALKRVNTQIAPACPKCGAKATWRDRSQILDTGLCPQCKSEFVSITKPQSITTATLQGVWRDETNGRTGNLIWIPVVLGIALVAMYCGLILPKYSPSKPITPFIFLTGIPLFLEAFTIFYIFQTINVLQEITLDGNRLIGKCYFGRRLNCAASDIESLSYYPMTWKIRYINLFDPKKPGINIVLKNGELFRVNARTEGFGSLVNALKALPNEANRTICDL